MSERRHIEREFGVPIAGEILPREQWTQTSLKNVPQGVIDWENLFGRRSPVVIDLGCGNGRFLIGSAVWRPDHAHLGIDCLPLVIRYATRRANQRGLTNIRFTVGDAHAFIENHVAPASITEIHCYHPQPYYDPSQVHRRLIKPAFLAMVHRALTPTGLFVIQTDNAGYWKYIQNVVPVYFEWQERDTPWPDGPKGRTRREIIAMRRGLPVFRAHGTPRPNLTPSDAVRLAEALPPPTFDADRRLREFDELESVD
jgi:tRNA (guanine-N7-)-methyltransferase